jgi:hypothetical protein
MNLSWYAARLRAMPPGEYIYRLQQAAEKKRRAAVAGHAPAIRFLTQLNDLPSITEPRLVRFFDISLPYDASEEIDWHRDYSSARRAPRRFYGNIDYRDTRQVGDAKYTWELNRHQFMVPWALNYSRTRDEQDVAAIVHLLVSWITANPKYIGINWTSSLELALRLLSWGIVFDLCRDAPQLESIRPLVERSVVQQANYIRSTLSLYSSANNHLVGELTGLVSAGVFFPDAPGTKQHAAFARDLLVKEAHRQTHTDGVNREQAMYYHLYTLEYLTTALALFSRAGWQQPPALLEIISRMLSFVHEMADAYGNVPEIGDRDDGSVTGLNIDDPAGKTESLLWTGWRIFGNQEFGAHSAQICERRGAAPAVDTRTEYWHGSAAWIAPPIPPPTAGEITGKVFPEGGYAILKHTAGASAFRATFKAGPFGYPRIAAHSHCDQLSITASLSGTDLLTDSGTYCYHSDEKWRRYFKGTSAHNTVRVDGREQAEYGGPFLWTTHANGELQEFQDIDTGVQIAGIHSGYRRLPQAVDHSRTVELRNGPVLHVRDTLASSAAHLYELFWNFGPDVTLQPDTGNSPTAADFTSLREHTWHLHLEGRPIARFTVRSPHPFNLEKIHGDESTPAGWYSRQFGKRTPITQLVISVTAGWWSVDSILDLAPTEPRP